jgi:hypothetical protein
MRKIDEWLRCEETGEPFSHCIRCKLPLLEIDDLWLVNKDYHRGECVMEYSICKTCRDRTTDQLSEGSREAVRTFLETEIDWAARSKEFMLMHDEAERFSSCIACRKERGQCDGFAISALYDSDGKLITGPLPLMICHDCGGRMKAVLSEESREVWRRFVAEHFAGPPDGEFSEGGFGLI